MNAKHKVIFYIPGWLLFYTSFWLGNLALAGPRQEMPSANIERGAFQIYSTAITLEHRLIYMGESISRPNNGSASIAIIEYAAQIDGIEYKRDDVQMLANGKTKIKMTVIKNEYGVWYCSSNGVLKSPIEYEADALFFNPRAGSQRNGGLQFIVYRK